MDCPRCGTEIKGGKCPVCNYTVPTSRDDPSDIVTAVKSLATVILVITFLGYLLFNTGLLLWTMETIVPETLAYEGFDTQGIQNVIFIAVPFPVGIAYLDGLSLTLYFLFLVGAIIGSLIYLIYSGGYAVLEYIKDVFKGNLEKIKKKDPSTSSPILRLITIFTALMFFSFTYIMLVEILGPGMETPAFEGQTWERIFNLLNASVWEEVVIRLAYIGVPMALFAFARGKKIKNYILGGFGTKEKLAVILVIFSSVAFALAHLPGWDMYKIPQTLIPGLAFGYLFIKDGLHSAILLHFFWNFMNVPEYLIGGAYIQILLGALISFWWLIGVYYTYEYLMKFLRWTKNLGSDEEKKKEDSSYLKANKEKVEEIPEPEDHTAGITIGYVCQNCGYNHATYTDDKKLKCKRCGTESDPKSPSAQQREGKFNSSLWPPS